MAGLMTRKFASIQLLCLLTLCGCSTLLPVAKTTVESPWLSFEEAKSAFDKIVPYQTTSAELVQLNFDPYRTPNIEILTYLNIIQRFMPNPSFTITDIDHGLQECIAAQNGCQAYEVKLQKIHTQRYGNVFLDLFRFKRTAHQSGWEFSALLVLKGDIVVYKIWGGKPKIDMDTYRKNPLGPLQEPADVAMDTAIITSF
jgi:hypothetical protein